MAGQKKKNLNKKRDIFGLREIVRVFPGLPLVCGVGVVCVVFSSSFYSFDLSLLSHLTHFHETRSRKLTNHARIDLHSNERLLHGILQ